MPGSTLEQSVRQDWHKKIGMAGSVWQEVLGGTA